MHLLAEIKGLTRPNRLICKKTGMQKKQVFQDQGYVRDACCMLSAKYWFQFVNYF